MKIESKLEFIILVEEEFYERNVIKYVLLVLIAVCRLIKPCLFKDKLLLGKLSHFGKSFLQTLIESIPQYVRKT
jgi:hypothetical protein